MPLHLSDDLKERIVQWYYIDQMTMEEICDLTKCSIGLVYNVIRNYRDFGQVRNPFTHCAGQPSALTNRSAASFSAAGKACPSAAGA